MTTRFDFDANPERRATASLKWDRYAGRDVLPLWIADMDFRAPPAVIEALHARVEHGVFGYTHAPATLIETVIERLKTAYGWNVEPDWIVWLPGLVPGFNTACRAVGADGDAVQTLAPVYPPFLEAPPLQRRRLIATPLSQAGQRWSIDFDRLEADVTPDTRLLMLCNPHNPVGRVYTRTELEQLAAFAERHDLVVCSDEIHCELILDADRPHIPIATLDKAVARRTITLMAPSKTFNLPGLGCGFAVIEDNDLRDRFLRARTGILPFVNALGYTAALAAYRDSGDWHRALLDHLRGNRDTVADAVAAMPGLEAAHVEATYLAWIDARGLASEDPAALFEAAGVGLSDGREFGAPGFVRLNFATSGQRLRAALERMQSAVSDRTVANPA